MVSVFVSAIMASAQTPAPSQREVIDLGMYARIQAEGFNHSRVIEYAGALDDDIGPRLTGSPEMAKANTGTRDTLTAMGCTNAHLEDWGEFGMGWEQRGSPLLMVAPEPAVFIAQAAPWSPGTVGANGKLSSLRATTSTASTRLPKPRHGPTLKDEVVMVEGTSTHGRAARAQPTMARYGSGNGGDADSASAACAAAQDYSDRAVVG